MRLNLKGFRAKKNLDQQRMADALGVSRTTYSAIETGRSRGAESFWNRLQTTFNVSDAEMWELTKNEEVTECADAPSEK